jgi:hypothetical protein
MNRGIKRENREKKEEFKAKLEWKRGKEGLLAAVIGSKNERCCINRNVVFP